MPEDNIENKTHTLTYHLIYSPQLKKIKGKPGDQTEFKKKIFNSDVNLHI